MHFTSHQKGLVRSELEKHTGQVMGLLESVLSTQSDEEVIMQAVKCVASWATIGVLLAQTHSLTTLLVAHVFNYHKVHSG